MKQIDEEIQRLLTTVVEHFDHEDESARWRQIRTWRKLKLLWEGFVHTWYSEVAHDWRIWDETSTGEVDTDQAFYDKPVNVFRAYLESIIAALSVTVPPVKCFPDDADNTLDLSTAKSGDKIAQLVYRHNDVSLLWLHSLYIYCTEGMVACYSYPKTDKSYGTYEKKNYDEITEEHEIIKCPNCGSLIDDRELSPEEIALKAKAELLQDEYKPGPDDIEVQEVIAGEPELCPECLEVIAPEIANETLIVTRLIGTTNEPKSRVCLEAYGGLNIKVPIYAKRQADCPYLTYSYETHYVNAVEKFEHLRGNDKLIRKIKTDGSGPREPYEEWGRLSPQYQGEYPVNNVTIHSTWLRPCAFNVLGDDEEGINKLKKKYPNGARVTRVNDLFGEAANEALDDCWTLTHNPMADFIHHDPLGLLLVSIQEITNDLISLILQTIEHGIPQTFADPAVLNFSAYRDMETTPGGIFEAKPKTGQAVRDAFHEVKTATLSAEVMPFSTQIQNLGQLASGALPSLFGGSLEGSETASQYSMSRAQALQRQQNTWKMLTVWWKQIFGKVIPMFIKGVKEDERDVQQDKDGNFINVFIRRAELEGKIGKVELEANENLPLTWSQIKDVIMKLVEAQNPTLMSFISSPENITVLRDALGLIDFYAPGEDSVIKQYDEIKLLLNSEPIPNPNDIDGTMPELPSIEIDPIIDVHPIEFEIIRKWATSEAGRQAKMDNEPGYRNVLLHGKAHYMQMQSPQPSMPPQNQGVEPPNPLEMQEAPITNENDVATVQ
jgi:hypothetical protein